MNLLRRLKHSIAAALSTKSAYDLAGICTGLGLAPGETSEAFSSKYKYVSYRLESLGKDESIQLAKNVLELGDFYHVQEALDLLAPLPGVISAITRRQIIDAVSDAGSLEGRLYVSDFLNRNFP